MDCQKLYSEKGNQKPYPINARRGESMIVLFGEKNTLFFS